MEPNDYGPDPDDKNPIYLGGDDFDAAYHDSVGSICWTKHERMWITLWMESCRSV